MFNASFDRWLITALVVAGLATFAPVYGSEKVMLVLDASGSMWGRVDDREKILIARDVINGMLEQWDENIELGLVAYGHRRKGDCGDIETLVEAGSGTTQAIGETVNGLQPRGKTPLSAAVLQAAEALKYSEDKATVILVSDGKETCGLDPCEVGLRLEQTGVDFTAHVIGFDISAEERAGLECLATQTGGRYFDAQRADELQEALVQAVEQIKSQPDVVVATLGDSIEEYANVNTQWTVTSQTGAVTSARGSILNLPPEPGNYTITAAVDNLNGKLEAEVVVGRTVKHRLALDAGRLKLVATASLAGEFVRNPQVDWQLEGLTDRNLVAQTRGHKASVVLMADRYQVTGRYEGEEITREAAVVAGQTGTVELAFEIDPASLSAPDAAAMASEVEIGWTGPGLEGDYITVVTPDADDGKYGRYTYTRTGNPLKLLLPDKPGSYELRYMAGQSGAVLARRAINVQQVVVVISAADQASISVELSIDWQGPDAQGDYLTVVTPDAEDGNYGKYVYTRSGSPAKLLMPDSPGSYEIRYMSGQSGDVLARRGVEIGDVAVTLEAPDTTAQSSSVKIGWTGPAGKGDYLTVVAPEVEDTKYGKYVYTAAGSPASLLMPDNPGSYEIRYVSGQSNSVLGRRGITIEEVSVSLTAPDQAPSGKTLEVQWDGPDGPRDYVTVVSPQTPDSEYGKYARTDSGNPVKLLMPDDPGSYEIRYVSAQSSQVLYRKDINITSVPVSLSFADPVSAGQVIEIQWTGPDGKGDYITVTELATPDDKYGKYTLTGTGNPVKLQIPDYPGRYEIRYIARQSRQVKGRQAIEVTDVTASLIALDIAASGQSLAVQWTGPANQSDRVVIANPADDDDRYIGNSRTTTNPLKIKAPKEPGKYELRYLTGQSKRVLARRPVAVVDSGRYPQIIALQSPGKVTLSAVGEDSGAALSGTVKWTVYSLTEGAGQDVVSSDQQNPALSLLPGVYRATLNTDAASESVEFILNSEQNLAVELRVTGQ